MGIDELRTYVSPTKEEIIEMEKYLNYFKDNIDNKIEVGLVDADVYKGDLSGLLTKLGIPNKYQYPNIRVNGYKSFSDFDGEPTTLYIVNEEAINKVLKIIKRKLGVKK